MENSNLTPNPLQPQSKVNLKGTQFQIIFNELEKTPATMLMLAKQTNIERANICRYINTMKENNDVAIVKRHFCKVTNYLAAYYTTDKNLFPKQPVQLKLF